MKGGEIFFSVKLEKENKFYKFIWLDVKPKKSEENKFLEIYLCILEK